MGSPASSSATAKRSRLETLSGKRLCERSERSLTRFLLADDGGQILPWVAVATVVLICTAALVLDVGNAMVAQRELQNATDAVALSAAQSISGSTTAYSTIGAKYGAAPGEKNAYSNMTVNPPTITPLCLTTVTSWGVYCASSGGTVTVPNAVQVTQTASLNTFFAGVFGKSTLSLSATSTAANGARPYNIALIVDSTLSMAAPDTNCVVGGVTLTQENCALYGVQQLLLGLNPTYDYVSLFTFPNFSYGNSPAGTVEPSTGQFACTTAIPSSYNSISYYNASSQNFGYTPVLYPTNNANNPSDSKGGSWGGSNPNQPHYQPPWSGVVMDMPYSFPPAPTSTAGYTLPSGNGAPTYQVAGFSQDYIDAGSSSLNSGSNLVKAVGGASGCGGLAPGSYDGNYGTYYAGALYAAQSALLAEQAGHADSYNAIIILGDGNSDAPQDTNSFDSSSPSMPSGNTEAETTYSTSTSLNTAFNMPSGWSTAGSSGSYPSYKGECGQAVKAAQYAATYTSGGKANNTLIFTIAYGALTTSGSKSCNTDVGTGSYSNITPCQTMQKMATQVPGETPSDYFYSDYNVPGGDSGCTADTNNSGLKAISQIYQAIAGKLWTARLIPNDTQ